MTRRQKEELLTYIGEQTRYAFTNASTPDTDRKTKAIHQTYAGRFAEAYYRIAHTDANDPPPRVRRTAR